jgi:hypothetical protein
MVATTTSMFATISSDVAQTTTTSLPVQTSSLAEDTYQFQTSLAAVRPVFTNVDQMLVDSNDKDLKSGNIALALIIGVVIASTFFVFVCVWQVFRRVSRKKGISGKYHC